MKVLVTGGAGFIGSSYVRLAAAGELSDIQDITVIDALTYAGSLDNLQPVIDLGGVRFVHGDIRDKELVQQICRGHDAVVHFAAESHVDRSIAGPSEFLSTNVLGTQVLLDAAVHSGVSTFVLVSTDEVYGSLVSGSWDEECPLLPNSPYAASKAGAELLARAYVKTFGLDVRVTRCCNNFGPYQHPEKAIPRFVTSLLRGGKLPIYGNGLNRREWIHVDDHVRAVHLALTHGSSGQAYNVGTGFEVSNLELADMICAQFGLGSEAWDFVQDRPGHDFRYSVDSSRIRCELGFEPKVSLEDGLVATVNWYRDNLQWWMARI